MKLDEHGVPQLEKKDIEAIAREVQLWVLAPFIVIGAIIAIPKIWAWLFGP